MIIDYKLPVEEIFRRFAEATIQRDGNLYIIQANGCQLSLTSLPSWVPDLSISIPLGTLPVPVNYPFSRFEKFTLRHTDGSISSTSTTGLPQKTLPGLNFRPDGALVICGKLIDTISAIGPKLPSETTYAPRATDKETDDGPCAFTDVFEQWESLAVSLVPGWGRFLPSSVTAAFAVTLVACEGIIENLEGVMDRGYSINAQAFASWYRLCGTGVLEAADPTSYLRDVEVFMEWSGTEDAELAGTDPEKLHNRTLKYAGEMEYTIYDRCFYVTEGGSMGLATPGARVGDRIAYIPGAYHPYVMRPLDKQGEWTMHGDCYLYGLDVYKLFEDDQQLVEEFVIR
ncbi:hypothetical protein PG989_015553 [Apiospora arundinis]